MAGVDFGNQRAKRDAGSSEVFMKGNLHNVRWIATGMPQ
jgi:hypothetical protein